jgi:hypothetical protein
MNKEQKAQALAEIAELKQQARGIDSQIREKQQALADALAKFRVGQRVIVNKRGVPTEYEITKVELGYGNEPSYSGSEILKSGRVGIHSRRLWTDDITAKTTEGSEP